MVPGEERKHSVLELVEGCLMPFADVNQLRQVDHRPPPRSSIHHGGHLANVGIFTELAEHELGTVGPRDSRNDRGRANVHATPVDHKTMRGYGTEMVKGNSRSSILLMASFF